MAEEVKPETLLLLSFLHRPFERTLWTWFKTLNSHLANFVAFSALKIALKARENHRIKHSLSLSLFINHQNLRRGTKRNAIRICVHIYVVRYSNWKFSTVTYVTLLYYPPQFPKWSSNRKYSILSSCTRYIAIELVVNSAVSRNGSLSGEVDTR